MSTLFGIVQTTFNTSPTPPNAASAPHFSTMFLFDALAIAVQTQTTPSVAFPCNIFVPSDPAFAPNNWFRITQIILNTYDPATTIQDLSFFEIPKRLCGNLFFQTPTFGAPVSLTVGRFTTAKNVV